MAKTTPKAKKAPKKTTHSHKGYSHTKGRGNDMQDVVNMHGQGMNKGISYNETIKGKKGGKKKM